MEVAKHLQDMQQSSEETAAPAPKGLEFLARRRRVRARWIIVVLALALAAAACGNNTGATEGTASGLAGSSADTEQSITTDDQSSVDGSSVAVGSTARDPVADDQEPGSQDTSNGAPVELAEGQCSLEQLNTELFYAVVNIDGDDPDGGLNLRASFDDSDEILATLPEGSVVFAEDCFRNENDSAWYAVTTVDGLNGWVNAAFLSPDIPTSETEIGGEETAARVEAVLDAMAARRWELAATELTVADFEETPLVSLLGEPGEATTRNEPDDLDDEPIEPEAELAQLLQNYCSQRICDAPYSIVDVRGSYIPERVSPEVDVSFTYSGGIVIETFGRISGETSFTLDTLPGQSVLAFTRTQPSATQLTPNPDAAPRGALEAAESVRRGLLAETGPGIADNHMPDEGVVMSSSAFIAPVGPDRQVVTAEDLELNRASERLWGYSDGVGRPIVETIDEWMAAYRTNIALLEPDAVGIDERVGLGNTIDNISQEFPDATVVEFHRAGRGELADFNWSSVRLALELRDREWKVVAITLDSWTA